MWRPMILGVCAAFALAGGAAAQTCSSYPNTLTNGTTADANQVMANFNCAALKGAAVFTGNAIFNADVGIGTSTPSASLTIVSTGNTSAPYVTILPQNLTQSVNISYDHIFEGGSNGNNALYLDAQGSGSINLQSAGGTGNVGIGTPYPNGALDVRGNIYFGPTSNGSGANQQTLASDGSGESMRLLSPGAIFLLAGASPTKLSVSQGDACESGTIFCFTNNGYFGVGVSPSYSVDVAGTVRANGYLTNSDRRLKTQVVTITGALDKVAHLRGVSFMWRPPGERTVGKSLILPVGTRQIGFVAQEVEQVVPEAVHAPKPGSAEAYTLDAGALVPVLVEAVKAQQAEIEALRAEVAALRVR